MVIGINCGHTVSGTTGSGAVGILNESDETRAVGYPLMRMLRDLGHTVIDCTDDRSSTVSENLRRICELANKQPLDMFLSIHFNSGGGKGTEAYTYNERNTAKAGEMLRGMEDAGFVNRGIKDGSRLYVIRNTKAPACLFEICFVDTQTDADLYKRCGGEKIAEILCRAIAGDVPHEDIVEGELDMSQYEELKKMIEELNAKVDRLMNPMIYNYIDDNMPEWARPTIQKLVDAEALKGDENGLNLTDEMLRLLVICDRMGLFDE